MSRTYTYKPTISLDYWSKQFGSIKKKMNYKDIRLLKSVKHEKEDNESIAIIHKTALRYNLYVHCLTKSKGDCLFESLELIGLIKERIQFRQSIALIFYLFGDSKLIFPYDLTLKQLFELVNEIEYVYCFETNMLYKYTYYTMCSDMATCGSWSRIPTEMVLTIISLFFKVRIHIYRDDGHISKICDVNLEKTLSQTDPKSNAYIGHIGEHHYIPLSRIPKNIHDANIKCPKYDVCLRKFHKWAMYWSDKIGLYFDEDTTEDEAEAGVEEQEEEEESEVEEQEEQEEESEAEQEVEEESEAAQEEEESEAEAEQEEEEENEAEEEDGREDDNKCYQAVDDAERERYQEQNDNISHYVDEKSIIANIKTNIPIITEIQKIKKTHALIFFT
jgi:hypothetical protein